MGKVRDSMFNPGNRVIMVKKVQELRGLANRWRYANKFWHYVASPINALMACADSADTWIRCDKDQIWLAFWNLMALVRQYGENEKTRGSIFKGKIEQAISIPKRVGRPRGRGEVARATGDAVIDRFASINWGRTEYILEEAHEYLAEIMPARRRAVICDTEQLAATSVVVEWSRPEILLLLGTDNRNVLAWTNRGYAKKGTSLFLNQATSRWIATMKCQVEGVYARSGHNFSPGWMTRTPLRQVEEWARRSGFARIPFRSMWGELMEAHHANKLKEIAMPEERTVRKVSERRICLEWNGIGGAIADASQLFGLEMQFAKPRHDYVDDQFCERYH